jgi:tripartite-type tricarboxylate transporter receptor subunit TctC
MTTIATRFSTLLAAACAAALAFTAHAQADYPKQPVKLIVPYSAGGVTDQMGRALAELAGPRLGQPMVIENRPGANGTLGAVQMLATDPAGYTLTAVPVGVFRMPHITGAPYDPLKDLTYLAVLGGFNYYIAVAADSPWKSVADMVAHAKRPDAKASYGSPGNYSSQHIGMAQLGEKSGARWVHVPYKGDAGTIAALLGGHVQVIVSSSTLLPYVQSGRIRVLATLGETRSKDLPDAPTLKELGYPIVHASPVGIAGPKGMDPEVVAKLDAVFKAVYDDPSFQATLARLGMSPIYMDHKAYTRYARETFVGDKDALKAMVANVK